MASLKQRLQQAEAQAQAQGGGEELPPWARRNIEAHCVDVTPEYYAEVLRGLATLDGSTLTAEDLEEIDEMAAELAAQQRRYCEETLGDDYYN